jgi:N-glycosylase/DNA lyase
MEGYDMNRFVELSLASKGSVTWSCYMGMTEDECTALYTAYNEYFKKAEAQQRSKDAFEKYASRYEK